MVKKGDTLIEVTLAVGIFSMVAISVVAVMTSGTSNAQTALETTLAREEIDAQAEALRFIHSAYLADEEIGANKDPYSKLWNKITANENVYTPDPTKEDEQFQFLRYNPTSCQDIYDKDIEVTQSPLRSKGFVINSRALKDLNTAAKNATSADDAINKVYIKYSDSLAPQKFFPASTYPRLIYNESQEKNIDKLVANASEDTVQRIEGIYVLAVKDPKTTAVVGTTSSRSSAYYDFYIRTCWYGTGADTPSTISTVIRLYDPKGIAK